ncbi:MAG: nucleoside deaminase [Acidimicrobiia bacterium]
MIIPSFPSLAVELPPWIGEVCQPGIVYPTVDSRMDLAIALARANITHRTGGPFGAAVFDNESGEIIAPGVNLVVSTRAAVAHAEMVAIALASRALESFDLGIKPTVLVASTEPCAMCLGAVPWSGVAGLVCGATDQDARRIGFDEGDKPEDWTALLQRRGIEVTLGVGRARAAAVLEDYARSGGLIYNGRRSESPGR